MAAVGLIEPIDKLGCGGATERPAQPAMLTKQMADNSRSPPRKRGPSRIPLRVAVRTAPASSSGCASTESASGLDAVEKVVTSDILGSATKARGQPAHALNCAEMITAPLLLGKFLRADRGDKRRTRPMTPCIGPYSPLVAIQRSPWTTLPAQRMPAILAVVRVQHVKGHLDCPPAAIATARGPAGYSAARRWRPHVSLRPR
jgi:hypothetical protein